MRLDASPQPPHLLASCFTRSALQMTDADFLAIANYLKDRAPRSGSAVAALAPNDSRMVAGKAIYEDRCAACHSYGGGGGPTLFPRLASAPLVPLIPHS
jgi:mono/diheme cytochrome c family protein